jgi:MFS superfamily sulfate permease-like transporter
MFANSDHVKSQIVVFDAETSPYVDVTTATMLVELRSILTRRGIDFRIARTSGRSGTLSGRPGDAPMLEIDPTIDDALAAYERRAQGSAE